MANITNPATIVRASPKTMLWFFVGLFVLALLLIWANKLAARADGWVSSAVQGARSGVAENGMSLEEAFA